MKFRDTANAAEFVEAYNGKQFNSMEVSNVLLPFLTLSNSHFQ